MAGWLEGFPPDWADAVALDRSEPWAARLEAFLAAEEAAGKTIYPPRDAVFAAFNRTKLKDARAVILGQDPYHGPGQAHGLSFSVAPGVPLPPSLRNIYKELAADLGLPAPRGGDLRPWADRGVLLLNAVLTVEAGKAGSHAGKGWEILTDRILGALAEKRHGLAFVLWGAYAQKKKPLIDAQRHLVLEGPHPSPLSAHRGFFGSKPFSAVNAYLAGRGRPPVDWRI